jgi:hypothetical protein
LATTLAVKTDADRLKGKRASALPEPQEIAAELAARYQIDASNMDAMNALVAKVRNALARQRGLASERRESEGMGVEA